MEIFSNLKPDRQLDEVLKCLSIEPDKSKSDIYIKEYIEKTINATTSKAEIISILDELIEDRFVKTVDVSLVSASNPTNVIMHRPKKYAITFKGRSFLHIVGGYEVRLNNQKEEQNRLSKIESDNLQRDLNDEKRDNRMVLLTFVLAFGTSIAAIYYLIEIVKFLYSYFHG